MKKLTLITLNRVPSLAEGGACETVWSLCSPKLCQPVIDPVCPPNLDPCDLPAGEW